MRTTLPSRLVAAALMLVVAVPFCVAKPVRVPKPAKAPKAAKPLKTREVVAGIDKQWQSSQRSGDSAAMSKLLAEDYLGITGNGQVVTKDQALDRMANRTTVLTRLDVSDQKIKVVGPVAIVTSAAEIEGTVDGKPIHGVYRSTRVYQQLPSGVWKLTSFEVTPTRGAVLPGAAAVAPPPAAAPSAVVVRDPS